MQKSKPRSRRHAHWLLPFASPGHGNEFSGRSSGCQDTQASLSALWLALQLGASSAVTSVEWLEVRRRTTRRAGHGFSFRPLWRSDRICAVARVRMSDCGSGRQQAVGFLGRTESCLSLFSRLKVYLGGSSAPHARMDGAPDLVAMRTKTR